MTFGLTRTKVGQTMRGTLVGTIKGNGETILSSMATIIQPAQRNLNINQALCGQHTAAALSPAADRVVETGTGVQRKKVFSHARPKKVWDHEGNINFFHFFFMGGRGVSSKY